MWEKLYYYFERRKKNMENNEKSNKGLIILIVIFSLMVLGLGGWMVYDKVFNKDEPKPVEGDNTKDNNGNGQKQEVTNNDESEENDNNEHLVGIIARDYHPFNDVKFDNKTLDGLYEDYKIEVKKNEIVCTYPSYVDGDEDDTPKKKSINANDVLSAVLVCDCGGCHSILYLNSKNELYKIDLHDEFKAKKIGDNYTGITYNDKAYIYPSTCDYDDFILKNSNGELFIYTDYDGIVPIKNVERTFVELAGNENEDDLWDRLIFIVNENTKVNEYFLTDEKKKIYAKVVINNDDAIYVIDENNIIYIYDNYQGSVIGKKYKNVKVKSYKINDNNIEIIYSDNTKSKFTGGIFDREELIK